MRTDLVRRMRIAMLGVIVFSLAAASISSWQAARAGSGPSWLRHLVGPPQVLEGRRIGIVAGHSGNDSGTVCLDGLTEAEVNLKVAEMVVKELTRYGATVDLLKEFDERLPGYRADAFVSIHTDSCKADIDLSGFKVASLEGGSIASAKLANCLWKTYAQSTGLQPNTDTITGDMRSYHSFREIAPATPAAIVEIGFLHADRALLTDHTDKVSGGIVAGIQCYFAGSQPGAH